LNGLGVLLVQSGRPGEGAILFRHALGLEPRLAEARLNLAVAEAAARSSGRKRVRGDAPASPSPSRVTFASALFALLRDLTVPALTDVQSNEDEIDVQGLDAVSGILSR